MDDLSCSCSCSPAPCGTTGQYKVELSSSVISAGDTFDITVTALTAQVSARTTAMLSGGSLPIDNISAFPTVSATNPGQGILVQGVSGTLFTWTGMSGASLTGVTGLSSVNIGDQIVSLPIPDTDYTGLAHVLANAFTGADDSDSDVQGLDLTINIIDNDLWVDGVATISTAVSSMPRADDMTMDVVVQETSNSSIGRTGSARAELLSTVSKGTSAGFATVIGVRATALTVSDGGIKRYTAERKDSPYGTLINYLYASWSGSTPYGKAAVGTGSSIVRYRLGLNFLLPSGIPSTAVGTLNIILSTWHNAVDSIWVPRLYASNTDDSGGSSGTGPGFGNNLDNFCSDGIYGSTSNQLFSIPGYILNARSGGYLSLILGENLEMLGTGNGNLGGSAGSTFVVASQAITLSILY